MKEKKEKKMKEKMKKLRNVGVKKRLKNGNVKKRLQNGKVKKKLQNGNTKKKFNWRNVGEQKNKNTRNGSERKNKNTRYGSERKNTRKGSERMKCNLKRQVGEKLEKSNSYLKKAKLNNCDKMQTLIDTGSSFCLLKISVAQELKMKLEPAVNKIYGFGNQKMPALTSIGRIKADIEVDNVKAESISIYVPDCAHSFDLIIGRTWRDLPHIA
ncbi:hypothetical protein AVEN_49943-1 [Araneus ventricosus]|uniref:Peptidase A2 domain-containing protein n=1 Tax=Araneus ventricosus TaxID=182803 RepID=A0A4Y2EIC5_ARAVE|nr:hypothetical protein AVEN_49943-1 [Araneus ventricosus]